MTEPAATQRTRPGVLDRLVGFKAMRFSALDVSVSPGVDEASELARIDQALAAAVAALKQRAVPAARNVAVTQGTGVSPAAEVGSLSKTEAIELAVQTWRLARRVEALDVEKFPREKKQFADSLRRFQKILETHGIEVVDPVGQVYVDGWVEVEVISWEPPKPGSDATVSTIKQTISPIVRRAGEIIARGQVVAVDVAT
jgi:hypothetical protein